ncbi:MAG: hypothetical protein P8Y47_01470 [Alphaproteobacteria bacterium]
MSTTEKAISARMKGYLRDVRVVLESNGVEEEEIADLLDNLRCHAVEKATLYLETMELEEAINRTLASLDAPETYASSPTAALNIIRKNSDKSKEWLGRLSALIMTLALVIPIVISKEKIFDTDPAGAIFIFGQLLALGTGIAAWPNIWAKVGVMCSSLLLLFLISVF